MNLLFLALDVDLKGAGGDAVHVRELVGQLDRLGHSVELVIGGKHDTSEVIQNVHITHCAGSSLDTIGECVRIARERKVDLIYERRLTPKVAYSVSRFVRIPFAVEVNGLPDEERALRSGLTPGLISPGRRLVRHMFLRRARRIVAVSEGIRSALVRSYKLEPDSVVVVPNGVNLDLFHPMDAQECRKRLRLPELPTIGFVGSLNPWQGIDVMIRAAAEIARLGNHFQAIVVGDGPERLRLQELVRALHVADHVRFIGAVPYASAPTYISALDVAFCTKPPLIPGSPLKVREYMACGRPVIASRGTGYDFHIIEEGRAGILVDPGDIDQVVKVVLHFLRNPLERVSVGILGREYAERHCSWELTARRIVEACT